MAFPGSTVLEAFDDDSMTIRDHLGIKDKLITHFDLASNLLKLRE